MAKQRTRAEVMEARSHATIGCCNRFADMMPCDCLEKAKPSVVEKIASRLRQFADDLEAGVDIGKKYKVTRVRKK
jgi:hypothetical protein